MDVEAAGSSPVIPTKVKEMEYTQMLGDTVELRCITKFIEMGYYCSIPYGNSAKYDFIVDIDGTLYRMQCKRSSVDRRNGNELINSFKMHTCRQTSNTKGIKRHKYSSEEIDYFCTYYEGNVYAVPVSECSVGKTLYIGERKFDNQSLAIDYNVEKIFGHSKTLIDSEELFNKRFDAINIIEKSHNSCKECGKEIGNEETLCTA